MPERPDLMDGLLAEIDKLKAENERLRAGHPLTWVCRSCENDRQRGWGHYCQHHIDALFDHIDAVEAALRAAVERCCNLAYDEVPCPDCQAALALLDGRCDGRR